MGEKNLKRIDEVSLETPPRKPASGGSYAMIDGGKVHIRYTDGLSWDEAKRLRDWLTKALDE